MLNFEKVELWHNEATGQEAFLGTDFGTVIVLNGDTRLVDRVVRGCDDTQHAHDVLAFAGFKRCDPPRSLVVDSDQDINAGVPPAQLVRDAFIAMISETEANVHTTTFEHAGLLTRDEGFVLEVRRAEGGVSEFQITIVESGDRD